MILTEKENTIEMKRNIMVIGKMGNIIREKMRFNKSRKLGKRLLGK